MYYFSQCNRSHNVYLCNEWLSSLNNYSIHYTIRGYVVNQMGRVSLWNRFEGIQCHFNSFRRLYRWCGEEPNYIVVVKTHFITIACTTCYKYFRYIFFEFWESVNSVIDEIYMNWTDCGIGKCTECKIPFLLCVHHCKYEVIRFEYVLNLLKFLKLM